MWVDLTQYRSLFQPVIRASLDWVALARLGAAVSVEVADSRDALGAVHTVWYADADGAETGYAQPGARPLTIAEVAEVLPRWEGKHPERVAEFEADMLARSRQGEPLLLTLPAYAVRGGWLLMDSTHRAVAAYRSGLPVRLLLLGLLAPVDAAILADLRHYAA